MYHTKISIFHTSLLAAAISVVCNNASAEGPWVMDEESTDISTFLVSDSYDEIWHFGGTKVDHPEITQQTLWLIYSYGYNERTTFSATVGYTQSQLDLGASSVADFSGLADSKFNVKYQLINEFWDNQVVTVSTKFGLITKGTYDRAEAGRPHSPGEKANGVEMAIEVGKFINEVLAVYSEVGYRNLSNDVPNEYYYNAGLLVSVSPKFSLSMLYAGEKSTSGTDLDDPSTGFKPSEYHRIREERDWVEASGNFLLNESSSIGLGYSVVIDGKNTGKSEVIYFSYSYSY